MLSPYVPYDVVIGLPLDERGKEGPAAQFAREFGEKLAGELGCNLHFVDERFTTRVVAAWRKDAGKKGSKISKDIDAGAAAALLQTFLDLRRGC